MPANLSPEYEKAEQRYRQATTADDQVAALQEMLSAIPKHKGTEKMQADLKRRLSQLRREKQKSGPGKGVDPFHIPKTGAGQVVLTGPPNTGKSSLLTATTGAHAKVAEYPFTTTLPQPGMWRRKGVQLELVDTPPLTADHVPPGLLGTLRGADALCVVAAAGNAALEQIDGVLTVLSARGLTLRSVPRNQLEPGQLSGLIVLNKADQQSPDATELVRDLYAGALDPVCVSAVTGQGLDGWFDRLWHLLALIRVYPKHPGAPPDRESPFALPLGSTVADLARRIHRDLPDTMKFARIWGSSRFDGQHVHKTEPLRDEDIVEIHG